MLFLTFNAVWLITTKNALDFHFIPSTSHLVSVVSLIGCCFEFGI